MDLAFRGREASVGAGSGAGSMPTSQAKHGPECIPRQRSNLYRQRWTEAVPHTATHGLGKHWAGSGIEHQAQAKRGGKNVQHLLFFDRPRDCPLL